MSSCLHDRVFLDAVIDKVAHLHNGRLKLYTGNYSEFRDRLEVETARAREKYEQRRKLVRKLEMQARKYETSSHRTEKKKQGAFDKGFVGKRAAKLMNRSIQARRRIEETIEKMKTEAPRKQTRVAMDFHASEARFLLSVRNAAVGYDPSRPLVRGLSFDLEAGDRDRDHRPKRLRQVDVDKDDTRAHGASGRRGMAVGNGRHRLLRSGCAAPALRRHGIDGGQGSAR